MVLSPKIKLIVVGGIVLILFIGYFLSWRLGQPPQFLTSTQEKTIANLEIANKQAAEERELLKKESQANAFRALQAQTEAAKDRTRLKELETRYDQIQTKGSPFVTDEVSAIKKLKALGWLK